MGTKVLCEQSARAGVIPQRIRRAQPDEPATLVVKNGGRLPLQLVFEKSILIADVRQYCVGQCGWHIDGLGVSIDGRHYDAPEGDVVLLAPTRETVTGKIEFGAFETPVPVRLEFRKKTGGKG